MIYPKTKLVIDEDKIDCILNEYDDEEDLADLLNDLYDFE